MLMMMKHVSCYTNFVYINIVFSFTFILGFLMVIHHDLDTKQTQLWFNRAHS